MPQQGVSIKVVESRAKLREVAESRAKLREVAESRAKFEVVRVRTRETLAQPETIQLILRAARACGRPDHALFVAELLKQIGEPYLGLFVGFADGRPCFTVCGMLPPNPLGLAPSGLFIYSERAPRQVAKNVYGALREWYVKNGYHEVLSLNTDYPNKVYLRLTRPFSADAEPIGSIIRYRF